MKKQNILNTAIKEFSEKGFSGARVEEIAKKANVNKAMIFYYFNSKENLYKMILKNALYGLFVQIKDIIKPDLKPEKFLEKIPEIYINYFANNREFIKIILRALIDNEESIKDTIREIYRENKIDTRFQYKELFKNWSDKGIISETSNIDFFMNIISLAIFSFIGKPIAEIILNKDIKENDEYYKNRINSIKRLLKRGLLK